MTIQPGINMEFVRHEDKPFAAGLELARDGSGSNLLARLQRKTA